ncbi:hypothetical protein RQP53_13565 [Paucibacter sp. APW11]|uniref:Uncharacterized protein n=1 Tax=Roseateles aquae TaxID=3077235 RepID=A0ABU3PCI3_9BURK|nr:hypothetical protein [Paucibacter sp. APW11]MDT9000296.1 hypothetical protein [Paucibacter sp. APW11]
MAVTLTNRGSAGLKAFSGGQAFRAGDVPAGKIPTSDLVDFQVSVLNRWPDGSLRFALLSGRALLAAGETKRVTLSVANASASAGALLTENALAQFDAQLSFAPFGSVSLRTLVGTASSLQNGRYTAGRVRQLFSGPSLSSWLYFSPIGGHAHLSAWFEVRVHAGGDIEILPWLENGWLDVPGPSSFDGTLSFSINGVQQLSQALTVPNHTRVAAINGAPLPYRVSSTGFAEMTHDVAYLQSTRLVPSYFSGVNNATIERQPRTFQPQALLSFPVGMGSGGYSPTIGLLPEWDVVYLASNGDLRARDAVLAHGLAAARYPVIYRDQRTNKPLAFSSYPDLVVAGGETSAIASAGASSKYLYTPTPTGVAPPVWATSHAPSIGYLAYLLSGWNFYAQQVQHAAALTFLKQGNLTRMGTLGVLPPNIGANTTRGAAWSIRTLAQAAVATPDAEPDVQRELLNMISNNINYYHANYVAMPNNPQGICAPYTDYNANSGKYEHAIWMEDFLTGAFGYLKAVGLPLAADVKKKLDEFFAWKAQSVVGRLGVPGDSKSYHYCDAAQFLMMLAPSDSADWVTGKGPWYSDWGQIYVATLGKANVAAASDQLRGSYFPTATSYWGNMQPALVYAVEHGAIGAADGRRRMVTAPNWQGFINDAKDNPVWALRPWSGA